MQKKFGRIMGDVTGGRRVWNDLCLCIMREEETLFSSMHMHYFYSNITIARFSSPLNLSTVDMTTQAREDNEVTHVDLWFQ